MKKIEVDTLDLKALGEAVGALNEEFRRMSVTIAVARAFAAMRATDGTSANEILGAMALTEDDEEWLTIFGRYLTKRAESRRAAKNIGAGYYGG